MGTSPQKLEDQILEDAEKKKKPILRRAQRKADNIVEEAREEVEKQREAIKQEAKEKAESETARILARAELEVENLRRAAREHILDAVRQTVEENFVELAQSDAYPDAVAELVLISVDAMTGTDFELVLTEKDKKERHDEILKAAEEKLEDERSENVTLHIADETTSGRGGVMVRRTDGSQICDQRFESRLDRLWPELRIQVADIVTDELEQLQPSPEEQQQVDSHNSQDDTDE